MKKELEFRKIIENIIGEINEAKRKSDTYHSAGNIKDSGDEIEILLREKISLFLPERYLVKQGHIVNPEGKVSNQFDIIIFDRLNTPKFFESSNGTVYYPIESVLAVGEIKKTLTEKHISEFGKKIKYLKIDMQRKLIENTIYNGKITENTLLSDAVNMRIDRKYKNPLFSFLVAIDEKGFQNSMISNQYMPNSVYVLNYGYFMYGGFDENGIHTKIEDEDPNMNTWIEIKKPGVNCLAMMLRQLIDHLNSCQIDPFSIYNYISDTNDFGILQSDVKALKFK